MGVRCRAVYLSRSNDELIKLEDFHMKSIALAAAFSLAATTAFAGSLAEPVVEAPVEEPAASSGGSSGQGYVGFAILGVLAVAAIIAAAD